MTIFTYESPSWNTLVEWTFQECENARSWHNIPSYTISTIDDGWIHEWFVLIPFEKITDDVDVYSYGYVEIWENTYLHIDTLSFKNGTNMKKIQEFIDWKYHKSAIIFPF